MSGMCRIFYLLQKGPNRQDRPGVSRKARMDCPRQLRAALEKWIPLRLFSITQGQIFVFLLAPKSGMQPAKVLSTYSNQSQFGP